MKKWVISLFSLFIVLLGIKDVKATSILNNPVYIQAAGQNIHNVGNYLGNWSNTTQYRYLQIIPTIYGSSNSSYEFQKFSSGAYNIDMNFILYTQYTLQLNQINMYVKTGNREVSQTCDVKNDFDTYTIIPELISLEQPSGISPKYLQFWNIHCDTSTILDEIDYWLFEIQYIDNNVGPLAIILQNYSICSDNCSEAIQTFTDRTIQTIMDDINMSEYNAIGIDNWLYAENSITGSGKQLFNDYQNQLNFSVDTNTQNFLWNLADTFLNASSLIIGTLTLCISIAFIKLVLNR